ncbi:MAG TPA: hypothetical protein VMW68_04515 [Methyloceanibacter sp.]|nr:hypothetical protein [Methyloceanibacter sp.]
MPLRGSVQLLLLFLRARATRMAGLGAAALGLLLIGAVQLNGALPSLGKDGFAQALRQSVWAQALAVPDQSEFAHWPWEDLTVNMSLAPTAKVPRLGLSAALLDAPAWNGPASPAPGRTARVKTNRKAGGDQIQGDVALGDVSIGDSITFTAADGETCVYRMTGRRVVDPHLAESEAEGFGGEAALFECGPLESLIMQATQGESTTVAPEPTDEQRKL